MLRQQNLIRSGWVMIISLFLASCGGSGDEYDGFDNSISASTPNAYLTFFNRQNDLAAGTYTIVAATNNATDAGTFSLSIRRNNGSATQVINGSWTSSGGATAVCGTIGGAGNQCYSLNLQDASGVTITLTTAFDGVLYLLDDSTVAQVVETANDNAAGVAEMLSYSSSELDETSFSSAYYEAIDPNNQRSTLQDYIALHGLGTPDVRVTFRDSKDLGYGRDMYMRSYANPSACGGHVIAFYVRNFAVDIVEGFAYGPVNLEAAINEDLQYHFGSNAIEFSTGRGDVGDPCTSEPMAKFYTFKSDYSTPTSVHPRLNRIDLDDRGAKAMPQPCISCHGGKLRPLDRFGRFVTMHANDTYTSPTINDIGDTKSRLQAFEVDTFEFSDQPGKTRADYEDGLRQLNAAIYCTYPGSAGHPACATHGNGVAAQTDLGEWSGDFGRELLEGWYGGTLETPGTAYDETFVPVGWTPQTTPGLIVPVGADVLWKKVIGPNCFVCHGKRGTEKGSGNLNGSNSDPTDGKDIDFGSFPKFIAHADEIERLVYDEGKMPLGLLNYENFWNDPEKAELMATFIAPYVSDPAGFSARRTDSSGNIILPGRIVPRAGPDRITRSNAPITLNAQASLFASSYAWSLISSPGGSTASIASPGSMRTDFFADTVGEYVIQMTASSAAGGSASDRLTVVVDDTLVTAPRSLEFYNDITARLATCASCHDGTEPGIPVWWLADASQSHPPPATTADPPGLGYFEQVMARVNLDFIEDSLMLKKPAGIHHFGDQRSGFNIDEPIGHVDRSDYDMFVNWIAEGSACGGTAVQCVR
ncbi:MAG: hypothetical protein AAF353_03420 [Pseudomonadota bacterium]